MGTTERIGGAFHCCSAVAPIDRDGNLFVGLGRGSLGFAHWHYLALLDSLIDPYWSVRLTWNSANTIGFNVFDHSPCFPMFVLVIIFPWTAMTSWTNRGTPQNSPVDLGYLYAVTCCHLFCSHLALLVRPAMWDLCQRLGPPVAQKRQIYIYIYIPNFLIFSNMALLVFFCLRNRISKLRLGRPFISSRSWHWRQTLQTSKRSTAQVSQSPVHPEHLSGHCKTTRVALVSLVVQNDYEWLWCNPYIITLINVYQCIYINV